MGSLAALPIEADGPDEGVFLVYPMDDSIVF